MLYQELLLSVPSHYCWWLIIARSKRMSWCKVVLQLQQKKTSIWKSKKSRKVRKRGRREVWWKQYTQGQDNSRPLPFSMAQQEAWEISIVWRRILEVGLEKQKVVAKYSRKMLSYYFGLTMFGNLEVFFVSLSLLSYCFVILIKYSRA